jgi:hypothetical protein
MLALRGISMDVDLLRCPMEISGQQLPGNSIPIPGGNMAIDVYLQIDGIKGESSDDVHKS